MKTNKERQDTNKKIIISEVVQCLCNSVQKPLFCAILLVLMDFSEPLNIVPYSQYAEMVVLHIKTAEFIHE